MLVVWSFSHAPSNNGVNRWAFVCCCVINFLPKKHFAQDVTVYL
jgi:hypothetical protein